MSLRPEDESDPLLAFDNERRAEASSAPPLEPAVQPVAAAEDRSPIQQPPESRSGLLARVERLEQALAESKRQIATLQSEKATLVRALADNRKQATVPPSPVPPLKAPARIASAIAGLAIGITLGIVGWMNFGSADDVSIAASEPDTRGPAPLVASAPEGYAQGLAPNVASEPARYERGQPRDVASPSRASQAPPAQAPHAPQAREAPQAPRYVGTLSIDAVPGGEVFINRQPAGHTPLRLENLRAGSHLIWIERDGYRRFTRVVQVNADRINRLSAELEPVAR